MSNAIQRLEEKVEELHEDTNDNPYSHIGRLQNKISQLHGEDIDGKFVSRGRLRDRHTFRCDREDKETQEEALKEESCIEDDTNIEHNPEDTLKGILQKLTLLEEEIQELKKQTAQPRIIQDNIVAKQEKMNWQLVVSMTFFISSMLMLLVSINFYK